MQIDGCYYSEKEAIEFLTKKKDETEKQEKRNNELIDVRVKGYLLSGKRKEVESVLKPMGIIILSSDKAPCFPMDGIAVIEENIVVKALCIAVISITIIALISLPFIIRMF